MAREKSATPVSSDTLRRRVASSADRPLAPISQIQSAARCHLRLRILARIKLFERSPTAASERRLAKTVPARCRYVEHRINAARVRRPLRQDRRSLIPGLHSARADSKSLPVDAAVIRLTLSAVLSCFISAGAFMSSTVRPARHYRD